VQEDVTGPAMAFLTIRSESWLAWKEVSPIGGCMNGETSSLQGYPVRSDKTPEACRVTVRHRRAYEGRPQKGAEGARANPLISDEGELKRDTNSHVRAT
jgi:hypothetical protein